MATSYKKLSGLQSGGHRSQQQQKQPYDSDSTAVPPWMLDALRSARDGLVRMREYHSRVPVLPSEVENAAGVVTETPKPQV